MHQINQIDTTPEHHLYLIPVKINADIAYALLDSGADSSWVNSRFVTSEDNLILLEKPITPQGFSTKPGVSGISTHTVTLGIRIMDKQTDVFSLDTFYVLDSLRFDLLLGLDWLKRHGVTVNFNQQKVESTTFGNIPVIGTSKRKATETNLTHVNTMIEAFEASQQGKEDWAQSPDFEEIDEDQAVTAKELASVPQQFQKYKDVFSKKRADQLPPFRPNLDIEIHLEEGGVQQLARPRAYKLSSTEREVLWEYLQDMLQKGFITPSKSPIAFPAFFVPKANTTELRLVIDYKSLNAITRKDRYTLPLISDILDTISKGKIFTKIDLRGAYNLLRVAKGHEWKTAFCTPLGTYEYKVMPFGLSNAPSAFQRWINTIFGDLNYKFTMVYLDDIIVYSQDRNSHIQHVHEVLCRLRTNRLYASPKKCDWLTTNLSYLGHIVTPETVQMQEDKLDAIAKWECPKTKNGIERFLGFANYYREFIRNFSHLTKPLTNLLRKDVLLKLNISNTHQPFDFPNDAKQAFVDIKRAFLQSPVLAHWSNDLPTLLETDASNFAIGAILSQYHGKDLKMVACLSRSFSPAESNYDIHDKELLSIIESFRHWRHFLVGCPQLKVLTDHQNLKYFMTTKQLSPRQLRWAQFLAQFRFDIEFRQGLLNGRCDALSRREELASTAFTDLGKAPQNVTTSNGRRSKARPQRLVFGSLIPNTNSERGRGVTPTINATTRYTRFEIDEDQITTDIKRANRDLTTTDRKELLELPNMSKTNSDKGITLWYRDVLFVPDVSELRARALKSCHDRQIIGHPGTRKMQAILNRYYAWPNDSKDVKDYVAACPECLRTKPVRQLKYGPLRPLEPPTKPWQSVTMDRITQLPESNGYTSIIVFVDRYTKMAKALPVKTNFNAEDLADLFISEITYAYGTPKEVISDRGPEFASQLWKVICEKLNIRRKLSTAYHPETDGQTERVNQTLEAYLRIYVNYHQDDWADLLPLAEFCYNSRVHSTTGFTPFEGLYGYNPEVGTTHITELSQIRSSLSTVDMRKRIEQHMDDAIEASRVQFDRKRRDLPNWKKGDSVMLSTRNLKVLRPTKKLGDLYIGPFVIQEKVSSHAFQLQLPASMRIHDVFHVSQLREVREDRFANQREAPPPPIQVEGETQYEVEAIIGDRRKNGEVQYRVLWKGYAGDESMTWEPEANINAPILLAQYLQVKAQNQDKRESRSVKSRTSKK